MPKFLRKIFNISSYSQLTQKWEYPKQPNSKAVKVGTVLQSSERDQHVTGHRQDLPRR